MKSAMCKIQFVSISYIIHMMYVHLHLTFKFIGTILAINKVIVNSTTNLYS